MLKRRDDDDDDGVLFQVGINETLVQFTNHNLPFGGVGASGIGAYHGRRTFDTFTHMRSTVKVHCWSVCCAPVELKTMGARAQNTTAVELFVRYPPYDGTSIIDRLKYPIANLLT